MNLDICKRLFLKLLRRENVVLIAWFLHSWVSGLGTEKCVCPNLSTAWKSRQGCLCPLSRTARGAKQQRCESQETWTPCLVIHKLDLTLDKLFILGVWVPLGRSALVTSQHLCCGEGLWMSPLYSCSCLVQLLCVSLLVLCDLFSSERFPFVKYSGWSLTGLHLRDPWNWI